MGPDENVVLTRREGEGEREKEGEKEEDKN